MGAGFFKITICDLKGSTVPDTRHLILENRIFQPPEDIEKPDPKARVAATGPLLEISVTLRRRQPLHLVQNPDHRQCVEPAIGFEVLADLGNIRGLRPRG